MNLRALEIVSGLSLVLLLFCVLPAQAQSSSLPSHPTAATRPSRKLIEQMLSWFPVDTETVIGATGQIGRAHV